MKSKIFISIIAMSIMSYSMSAQYVNQTYDLNQAGALKLAEQANLEAKKLEKNVSIAVLNASGITLLLLKGDNVGPHNTEASRKKAYTSLSTKTPSMELMRNAAANKDALNLNSVSDLLLLAGGMPIWKDGQLIGSIGISGGGSGQNDNSIALKTVESLGFKTKN